MMRGDEWKVGDVLFLSGDGASPTLFIAEQLPGSCEWLIRGGCYSRDNETTRKATIEDADGRIAVQMKTVQRELASLQRMFELREKIKAACEGGTR